MKNSDWSNEKREYDLTDGYGLVKADWKDLSVYFAVYEVCGENIWFRKSFEQSCTILENCDECFWIKKGNNRIGGVLLEPNYMNCLFLIPPYVEYDLIISKLKQLLLIWSDEKKRIILGGAIPDKVKYFQKQGFMAGEARRCMIRPTEDYEVSWDDQYILRSVTEKNLEDVSRLFTDAYISPNSIDYEHHLKEVHYYYGSSRENDLINKASTLIYDRKTDELVGACLISIWEEWPNIYDVAVKPTHQKQGLARNMIQRALTVLKPEYPVLRLFVTLGNDAEMLYHKMGFLPGVEWTEMYIPAIDQFGK